MTSQDLLAQRRNRAIAILLGHKEREVDPHLPPEVSAKLRKVILDQVNDLYEFCLDVHKDDTETVVLNDLYRQKIDALYDVLVVNG